MDSLKQLYQLARSGDKPTLKKLGVFALVAIIAIYVISSSLGPSDSGTVSQNASDSTVPVIYVDIVGAVEHPGVYPASSTTRLFEVISAAGGFSKNADQKSVNLARLVTDGEQIIVQTAGKATISESESKLLSLNAATSAQLEELPGVGPKLAGRIIDWRVANGGFKKVDQLLQVGGIGDKLFAGIRNMVRP